jgi:isocitrate/isopropylmalate dehydrogenase
MIVSSCPWPKGIFADVFCPLYSKTLTRDMGGEASTFEFTRAILDKLEEVHKA